MSLLIWIHNRTTIWERIGWATQAGLEILGVTDFVRLGAMLDIGTRHGLPPRSRHCSRRASGGILWRKDLRAANELVPVIRTGATGADHL